MPKDKCNFAHINQKLDLHISELENRRIGTEKINTKLMNTIKHYPLFWVPDSFQFLKVLHTQNFIFFLSHFRYYVPKSMNGYLLVVKDHEEFPVLDACISHLGSLTN